MRPRRIPTFIARADRGAFTVVELLVAISVLSLIVLVLYGLFDQVQKALRSNVAQVDVLEGGRSAMLLMSGELEQMQAGNADIYLQSVSGQNPINLTRDSPEDDTQPAFFRNATSFC